MRTLIWTVALLGIFGAIFIYKISADEIAPALNIMAADRPSSESK